MGLLDIASGNSVWRGLDYYKEKKVVTYQKISEYSYSGNVTGSNEKTYNVFIDVEHPKKSLCNCPHANDKKIICKHKVALYFAVFPDEVDKFLKEVEKVQKEYEEYEEELHEKTIKHIYSMPKQELQESLIEILEIAPDWIYDRFIRDNVDF